MLASALCEATLAEDMQRDAACPRSRRSRRGRRARRTRDDPRPRPGATAIASDDEHHSAPVCPDSAAAAGADTWRALDDVDLAAEMRHPVPTLQDVPPFMRAAVREALVQALRRLRRALTEPGSAEGVDAARAWKLFLLAPRMLLTRTDQHGSQGRAELLGRASAFQRGDWLQLLQAARRACRPAQDAPPTDPAAIAERKRHQACFKVKQGELSRARQVLTTCDLAPGTEATWAALTDPVRRPREPRTTIAQDVLHHQPDQPPHLTTRAVAAALRSARRGCAPGLSGMRAEHLKLLLQDSEALELLAEACTLLAQARVPTEVCKALAMARLTALRKPDGGVRGIATGDTFRRLVSKTLAREWAAKFDQATRPFQFALQARAGTDALAAHVRAALETRPGAVLVSLDGRSAYDSMSRAAFLGKLREVAPELLPFVRLFYGSPSTYCWWDAAGRCRDVCQGEGCEQGDALAPALYALGQHDALQQASDARHPDDTLVAFLDDLYVITSPSRARAALDETVRAVEDRCGIASNLGKTRVIAATAGPAPPGIAELGDDVWRGDKPDAQRGVVVLGSPVGHPAFVQGWAEERLRTEQLLLDQLPKLPDLQCAWLLLLLCASPRANHAIRTMPPSASAVYARGHDDAIWATLQTMLGGVGDREAVQARLLAALPGALGGLGLQSAQLTAPAAYWAAWADALPALHARVPGSAASYVQLLEAELGEATHCLAEAANARRLLLDRGWSHCPTWRAILEGARPALAANPGAGDWPHGWQYHASRTLTEHSRECLVMPSLPPSSRALLRSQAGPHAGAWLTAIPCENTTTLPPQAMQVAYRGFLDI